MIASVDSPAISQVLAENIRDALIIFKSAPIITTAAPIPKNNSM